MRPQDLLRFHPFVEALGERAAEELLKHAITRRFQPDDVIFRQGDPGTGLYDVVSGRRGRRFGRGQRADPERVRPRRVFRRDRPARRRGPQRIGDRARAVGVAIPRPPTLHAVPGEAQDQPTFPVSQGELGRMAGVSREIVARQLAIWRRAGLVEMQRGRITLRDRAALAAMVGNV
jgi:CRP-like cAMP-binding protein